MPINKTNDTAITISAWVFCKNSGRNEFIGFSHPLKSLKENINNDAVKITGNIVKRPFRKIDLI